MARISERTWVYLVGLSLAGVGGVLFFIGFATPNWIEYNVNNLFGGRFYVQVSVTNAIGLWQACSSTMGVNVCVAIGVTSSGVVHHIVQALECITLMTFLGFGAIAFLHNFTNVTGSNVVRFNGLITFLGIIGGILGVIGAVLFVATNYNWTPSWSFGLVLAGCVLVLFGTVMMACSASQHSPRAAANRGVVYQTSAYPPGTNQPQVHVVSTTNNWSQQGYTSGSPQYYNVSEPAIG
ncbi:uncharacterized protein LOC121379078 [Gigantopelta aegis]|uniref:uncharacterized protein LOC121379078 n=1 Tax=Gigantopelta aegis TaxID=1735272 RepID=UPI001B88A145|nr:uncharacterized protein LOC121379078 [Gigantopelta aegis]